MRDTGVLIDPEIRQANIIAANPSSGCFKPASYDLRIGDQYVDPMRDVGLDEKVSSVTVAAGTDPICVPAYSFIVVSTHEILKIPGDVIGKFNLRIRWALEGLFVQMGTQVEPNYHGRLFAVLHNITARDITIKRVGGNDNGGRDRIFTIEFYRIGTTAPLKTQVNGADEIVDNMNGFVDGARLSVSAINEMFKQSVSFEENLTKFKSEISTDIAEMKSGLLADAKRVLDSAELQMKTVSKISDFTDAYHKDAVKELERKFAEKSDYFLSLDEKVTEAISDVKRDRGDAAKTVVVGGIVVVLASALIPYCISLAVSLSNPTPESILAPIKEELSEVKQSIEKRSNEDERISTLTTLNALQQDRINQLVNRIDTMQTQLNSHQAPVMNGENGGRAQ